MQRTVKHIFKTESVVTDVTKHITQLSNHRLSYAKAKKIILNEGTVLIQYFSHFLFFLELTSFELHRDLEAGFTNEKARLFLFMMLKGSIVFLTKEESPIIEAHENTCYATYNRKGGFLYNLPKGNHEFFYVCPRTSWLSQNDEYYPRIGEFLQSTKRDRKSFDHMSTCTIDQDMQDLLYQLFSLNNTHQITFESNILKVITSIIDHYQLLLDLRFSQRAYLVKDYLDTHYPEFIDNSLLASQFFTTEKTLIKTFKQEFGTTPHQYLISVRMEQARNLLLYEKLTPTQVYPKVGYSDFHSFRKQFKNYFGIPPSEC